MADMTGLLTWRERMVIRELIKPVLVPILGFPPAIVIACVALLGLLASLNGQASHELILDFVLEVAPPVVSIQAKMLMIVGVVSALSFIAGRYRLKALTLYFTDRLQACALRLEPWWPVLSRYAAITFCLPANVVNQGVPCTRTFRFAEGHIPGRTPKLE